MQNPGTAIPVKTLRGSRLPNALAPPAGRRPHSGRPPYVPTKEGRQMVTVFRAVGLPIEDIAQQLGIDKRTLYKYFREEITHGKATIVSRIGGQVVKKALAGDNSMIQFYLKNHGGEAWKDKARLEHTGADGTALIPPSLVVSFLPMKPGNGEGS